MKSKLILIGAVVLLALAASAMAADVAGKWQAEQAGRDGQPTTTTWTFKVEGTTLTGTMTTAQGESTISEGKIAGDEISFVVARKMNMGGQDMEMKTTWKGKVAGDQITFTREFQMPAGGMGGMGGPGGGAGMGGPPPGGGAGMGAPPGGGAGGPGGGAGGGAGRGGPPREIIAKRVK
jgi:opacity protein-like surface antigen